MLIFYKKMGKIRFKKTSIKQSKLMLNSEDLYFRFIDKEHILFKIKEKVDFEMFRERLEKLYSEKGQNGYDPILLLQTHLLLEIENIDSNRDITSLIKVNLQYRHFLDLGIDDEIFNHSVLSRFRTRVGIETLNEIFEDFVKYLKEIKIIKKSDERYMDAVHHIANVSIISINNLLARANRELYEEIKKIDKSFEPKNKTIFEINEFSLSDEKKKERFVNLVKLGQELKNQAEILLVIEYNSTLNEKFEMVSRIIKERAKFNLDNSIEKENNKNEKGRLASFSDKDATWGTKSKNKHFLGYKTNVIITKGDFVEHFSVHQGYENDENFFEKDIKKTDGDNISTDTIYSTIKNRKIAKKRKIKMYSPIKKNSKEHLKEKIMEEAFQFNKTDKYKQRRKSHWNVERNFADMKNNNHFGKMRYRGFNRVQIQICFTLLLKNMKSFVNKMSEVIA